MISATPFVKLDGAGLDFRRLCRELDKQDFIANVDIAPGNTLWDENKRFACLASYVAAKNERATVRALLAFSANQKPLSKV